MTVFRYPRRALIGDYVRTAIGLGVGLGVLLTVPPSPVILIIFGGTTLLFAVFGLRTVQRHRVQVAVSDEGIEAAGLVTRRLRWEALERFSLRYYGSRRQQREGRGGYLQLGLHGDGTSVRLESSIEGFDTIIRRAARAARENGVTLDKISAGNLAGLGVETGSATKT